MRFPLHASALILTALLAATPRIADAQSGYRFRQPQGTLGVRLGVGGPAAHGELFSFFSDELTIKPKDFISTAIAVDIGVRAAEQLDIVFGLAHDNSSTRSEFNDWVDTETDEPIKQTTDLARTAGTVSAKFYVMPRGRSLAKHAWIPASVTPYLTLGGGYTYYDLKQYGDFVDYETLEIFTREFRSDGGGLSAHLGGGSDFWVTPTFGLTAEGRYAFGSAKLEQDFSDFDKIDLRGFQVTAGITLRF